MDKDFINLDLDLNETGKMDLVCGCFGTEPRTVRENEEIIYDVEKYDNEVEGKFRLYHKGKKDIMGWTNEQEQEYWEEFVSDIKKVGLIVFKERKTRSSSYVCDPKRVKDRQDFKEMNIQQQLDKIYNSYLIYLKELNLPYLNENDCQVEAEKIKNNNFRNYQKWEEKKTKKMI